MNHSAKHELLDNVTSSIHLIQMKKSKIFNQKSESEIILDWYLVKNYWSKKYLKQLKGCVYLLSLNLSYILTMIEFV